MVVSQAMIFFQYSCVKANSNWGTERTKTQVRPFLIQWQRRFRSSIASFIYFIHVLFISIIIYVTKLPRKWLVSINQLINHNHFKYSAILCKQTLVIHFRGPSCVAMSPIE